MQHHIIQQQMFDVSFSNADNSYQLQNKISDVFHNQLTEGMEQLFNKLVPAHVVLSLGDVTIDIGSIDYNQIEYELTNRILIELEREINYRLALVPSANGDEAAQSESKTIEGSYASLLEYFLLTGAIPWWATGEMLTDPLKVMEHLLVDNVERLKKLIIAAGQQGYVRQRLVYQFPEKVIQDIITILEPADAAFILDYHSTVVKKQQEEQLIENAPATEFEKALWLFILTYILVDRGSLFNQKNFVKATLSQMAHHYNRVYADILALLAGALAKYTDADKQHNELLVIITELSIDEFEDNPVTNRQPHHITNPVEDIVQQRLELIKHYLVFGSLPWWSEPYGEDGLGNLFLELIKIVPKALSKFIVAAGQKEEVRKRVTHVFPDEVISAIVKILEPADAAFIINYVAEVQQIHIKKPVVNTDSKSFKKAVWKFVFDFLLTERGSEFNQRMFLESNIRKLAANYNVQYTAMLMYLVQSIGQVHQDNIDKAPLFRLLAALVNDQEQRPGTVLKPHDAALPDIAGDNETHRLVVLKDVLLHWLNYGSIPWWGNAYFEQGPVNLFLSLLATAPDDAFILLKYAGTMPNVRKRVIYQFPAELIMDAFAQQAEVEQAIQHYNYLLETFTELSKTIQGSDMPSEVATVLTEIFWNVYIAGQYKSFNDRVFLQKAIQYLRKQIKGDERKILKALRQIFTKAADPAYLKSLETDIIDYVFESDIAEEILLAEEFADAADISRVISDYLSAKAPTKQEITDEVLRILEYFINANKLPPQFKSTNQGYINAVIRQLLRFLNKQSPKAYKQVLSSAPVLKQYTIGATGGSEARIEGSIEQVISNYLHHEKQANTEIPKENILNEALTLLQYFLTNGKLPEGLSNTDAGIKHLLKQLLLMLNYSRPGALNDILQREGYLASAKMQLHNLFALAANTAEENVSRTLKSHLEKDIIQYIRTLSLGVNADDNFTALVEKHLSYSADRYQLIASVLKQASAARYIARHYTDAQVQQLLSSNTALVGGTENLTWLGDLQLLITGHVTDTLQLGRLNNLIREFNLLVLGGHVSTAGFTAYIKQLLRFIAAENYALFILLSDVMLKADATPGLGKVFTAKLSDVLAEAGIQKANDKTRQNVRKQLSKADEDALQNATGLAKQKAAETRQLKDEIRQNEQQTEELMKSENKKILVNTEEPVYINNAGLVLLNPFLSTFFVRVGIMTGGKFISEEAQLRAVHLLQYLVNGSHNSQEHLLVLNKILCNVPIEEPVPGEITLTDEEKTVAQGLLNAVLQNWDKLKGTSVEGLQSSFLQRDGALVFKDDAWNLKIDQRGYDVLLQTLPWGIGMIKTAWMDKFLYVEWI